MTKVGVNESNKFGWYTNQGDIGCSNPTCQKSKTLCQNGTSCKNIATSCGLANLQNL